jgi:hypothetical protein
MIEPAYRSTTRSAGHGRPIHGGQGQVTPWIEASDVRDLVQPLEGLITKYPAAALASAFLLGVALACWIKRK